MPSLNFVSSLLFHINHSSILIFCNFKFIFNASRYRNGYYDSLVIILNYLQNFILYFNYFNLRLILLIQNIQDKTYLLDSIF